MRNPDDSQIQKLHGLRHSVFGTDLLSACRQYDNGYAVISNELKDCFMRGDLVIMSFRVNNLQSHVVTLWGAEYDQNGKLSGVYFSESDDRESVGMQRYMVFDVGGKAVVSTRVKGAADRTNAESYSVTYVSGKLTVLPKEVPPTPTPEPEAPGKPATPENPAPSVIQPMPEDVTTVPDAVEKIEQDHKQEEKEQTEEVSAEKQELASGTKPEAEKNSLPESTSDSVPAESTVTATQNNTGSTVAKVVAGTAAALVAIAGGVFIFRKRKERKK